MRQKTEDSASRMVEPYCSQSFLAFYGLLCDVCVPWVVLTSH